MKAAAAQGQFVANATGSGAAYASAEDVIHAFLVALAQANSAVFITFVFQPLFQQLGGVGGFLAIPAAIPFLINLLILTQISLALTGQTVAWGP